MPAPRPLWLSLSQLAAGVRQAPALRVACDFDGTLVPVAEHPDDATLPSRAASVLAALAACERVDVALASGRKLADLERQIGDWPAHLVGSGGLETRTVAGHHEVHPPAGPAPPASLRAELAAWGERFPGAWIEDKAYSLAVHYRGVAAERRPAFAAGVRRRLKPQGSNFALLHGRRVFEIRPAGAWDKGTAIADWLGNADGLVFNFGDDLMDEPVHRLVRDHGGVSVAVDRAVTAAEYSLPSPDEVVWALEWLLREWRLRLRPEAAGREVHAA